MENTITAITESAERKKDFRKLLLTLACAAIMLMACLLLNTLTFRKMQKSSREESIIRERLVQMHHLMTVLQDIELGLRGYVLTGSERHLEIYNESKASYTKEWLVLSDLVRRDGEEMEVLEPLRLNAERLVELATQTATVRQEQGMEAAVRFFAEPEHRGVTLNLRNEMDEAIIRLKAEEKKRSIIARQDFHAGLLASFAMGFLALCMGGLALFMLRRVLREMKRAQRYALSMLRSEESRRQKDVFLATMSHEIRTPLNAIIGFGELAQKEEMGSSAKRYLSSILEGGNALLRLINDILDLSKLEAGRMDHMPEPANIHEVMDFMRRLFQETCAKKGLEFRVETQPDLPESLLLDAPRLRQVLMNLIGNAVKFTENGTVEVLTSGSANSEDSSKWNVSIKVKDSGKGMADTELPKIFEPFYQSPNNNNIQGTGLGLSIAKRFVKLMGGEITARSGLGEGTEFRVSLPARRVSSRLANDPPAIEEAADFDSLRPSRLLVVDDNEMNLELVREIFHGSSHTVFTATNGQEALEAIGRHKPDVVLMDLRMPVMDGVAAAAEIKRREDFASLPVIAVTAGSLPGESDRLADSGDFDHSLRKPFTRRDLFAALSLFLSKRPAGEPAKPIASIGAELHRDLLDLLEGEWRGVKASMIVSEVEEFAAKVASLADGGDAPEVSEWAASLSAAAEECAFARMEKILADYPKLLERPGSEEKS